MHLVFLTRDNFGSYYKAMWGLEIPPSLALQTPDFSPCAAEGMICNFLKLLTITVL